MMDFGVEFASWIGRVEDAPADQITPRLVDQFTATLGPHLADVAGAPLGIHWCLSPPAVAENDLGADGHPKRGGFLPPIPLPRRMWAGGKLNFLKPLPMGAVVGKSSTLKSIQSKEGRSGPLCFVAVDHVFHVEGQPAVQETHDIVYRGGGGQLQTAPTSDENFTTSRLIDVTTTTLFRYSALTFNGHRIHYDLAYAQGVEGYRNLVIHGPLQATLLLNFAADLATAPPKRFTFKGLAPATGPQTLRMGATLHSASCNLGMFDAKGIKTMSATADW